jgi:hypothetical protein
MRLIGYQELNRALLRLARQPTVTTKLRELPRSKADAEWSGDKRNLKRLTVRIDAEQTGTVPAFIHELLHVFMEDRLKGLKYEVLEDAIEGWEKGVLEYVLEDSHRLTRWRKALRRTYGG